jgi:hypothetical protein
MQPQPQPQGQGGPAAPPINMNFPRPGPGDNPNNAGPAPTDVIPPYQTVKPPEPQAQPNPMSALAPPGVEKQTPDLSNAFSPQHLVAVMQKQGIPQERWAGVIGGMDHLFKEVSDEQQRHLEYEKSKASEAHQRYMELLGNRRADQADAREDRMQSVFLNTVRHQGVTETQGDKKLTDAEEKEKFKRQQKLSESTFDPEQLKSVGSIIKTGVPLNIAVPGYGDNAVKKRTAGQMEAIRQIREDNPGMSAEQAGVEYANKTIEYSSGKASSGQLTKMLGATKQAVGQLDFNIDKAREEIKKLPSSDLSPAINAIARGVEKWTGDPAYASTYFYMHAVAMESARILAGGQASIAQLNASAAEEAKKWISMGMTTPAMLEEVGKAMKAEGQNRIETFNVAIGGQKLGQKAGDSKPPGATHGGVNPATGKMEYFDDKGNKL